MAMHTYHPSTQEVEVGGSPSVQGQPGLLNEFKTAWAVDETLPQNTIKKVGDGSVSKVLAVHA